MIWNPMDLKTVNNGNKEGQESLLKPPVSPTPVQNKDQHKKINMEASITMPTLSQPKQLPPKTKQNQVISKAETHEQKGKQVQRTGGVLSGRSEIVVKKTGATERGPEQPEQIKAKEEVMQSLIDSLFFYEKIKNNEALKQSDCEFLIEMFGLFSEGQKERKISYQKLDTVQGRKQILKIRYLANEKDEKLLDQINLDLCLIIKQLISKSSYISVICCVQLIEHYISLNKSTLYTGGKFSYKQLKEPGTHFQGSKGLKRIVKEIIDIHYNILLQYEPVLQLLVQKRRLGQKCVFLQRLMRNETMMRRLSSNVWVSFINVIKTQNGNRQKGLKYNFQINILLNCINLTYTLSHAFFSKETVVREILPIARQSLRMFEDERSIVMTNLDNLVLNLILVHPFTMVNMNTSEDVRGFLLDIKVKQRYEYLSLLLNDEIDPQEILPLTECETSLFLQNYLKMNQNFNSYSPSKHAFIFNSICNIINNNPAYLRSNKFNSQRIHQYMDYIVYGVFKEEENYGEEQYENGERQPKYLGVCRLAKLMSSVCFSERQAIDVNRFSELIKNDSQIAAALLRLSFQVVKLSNDEIDNENGSLELYSISTQVVYEMLLRLIIYDAKYFQSKSSFIFQYFDSLQEFYEVLFVSHITYFADISSFHHLNFLALASMISTAGFSVVCKNIMVKLSSLKDFAVSLVDEEGIPHEKSQLEYVVSQIMSLRERKVSNLTALAHLLLSILAHNPSLLQNEWIKCITREFKRLIDTHHPLTLTHYAQTLTEVLLFLSHNNAHLRDVEAHFDFRFVSLYLFNVLAFQWEVSTSTVDNKYMKGRKYQEIRTAVKLLKEMTNLYLKEKEEGGEIVPLEIRRILELENKGGNFQLLFAKEATSYSVGLINILLAQQFTLDQKLRKQFPTLKDEVFQTLINLNKIGSLLQYDISPKIHHLYSRHAQLQLNESLKLKEQVIEQIKWNPSFLSLQYLMSWSEFRQQLKKQIFDKVKNKGDQSIYSMKIKSHFVSVFWKQISSHNLRMSILDGWKYVEIFLQSFRRGLQLDIEYNQEDAQVVVSNIFKLSILLKKTSIDTYFKFLINNYHFFFLENFYRVPEYLVRNTNSYPFVEHFHEAVMYFLNIKSLVPNLNFAELKRDSKLPKMVKMFVLRLVDERENVKRRQKKSDERVILEIMQHAINLLLDLCPEQHQQLTTWLDEILTRIMQSNPFKDNIITKQIIMILLLHAKLSKQLNYHSLNFSNHHWLLLTNISECNERLTELLLIDLPNIYNEHPVFFISICHYFRNLVRNSSISQLAYSQHIKVKGTFLEMMAILLNKVIKECKPYYAIWVVEIFTEIVANEDHNVHEAENYQNYLEVRRIILTSQVVHSRISLLLAKMAASVGSDTYEFQGCWGSKIKIEEPLHLSEKLELTAYLKLLTLIHFSRKHQHLNWQAHDASNVELISLAEKEKEIFLSITNMAPLLQKFIKFKENALIASCEVEKSLSSIQIDSLCNKNVHQSGINQISKMQVHELWPKGSSSLDLLNQASNYELVSICTIWLTLILQSSDNHFIINHQILNRPGLDKLINQLVGMMDESVDRLQKYIKCRKVIEPILDNFKSTVYHSLAVSKEMHFTNCSMLNSHISFSYDEITEKLAEVVLSLHKILHNIFRQIRRGTIHTKSQVNYRLKVKNLKSIESLLKGLDETFSIEDKSTMKNESQFFSKNRTKTLY